MAELPHPDEVMGVLARAASWLRPPVRNSLARVGVYEHAGIAHIFPPPARVPDLKIRPRWRLRGLVSEDLVFESLHDPLEPEFQRYYHARRRRIHTVYARRIRSEANADRPQLLYLHGYMQPESLIEEVALLATMCETLGMDVVQVQPPYHGRRTPRASRIGGELFWTADLVRSLESLRQTVLDARTLLGWMQESSPRPVGVAGLSLGGALTATLTCLDPRFAFSAPFIAHMDLAAMVADAPVLGAMRDDLARFGWSTQDFAAFIERLGWNELRPVIPRERIHLFGASEDRFFDPKVLRRMWREWGRPKIWWVPTSHMGFIAHLPEAMARLRVFVDRLDLVEPRSARTAKARSPRRG